MEVRMRNRKHPLNEMRDCPECGRRLKWSGDVAVCKCGAKITFKTPNSAVKLDRAKEKTMNSEQKPNDEPQAPVVASNALLGGPHRCDTCAKEFATCDARRIVWGIDRDPSARGADADKVLECDAYTPNAHLSVGEAVRSK